MRNNRDRRVVSRSARPDVSRRGPSLGATSRRRLRRRARGHRDAHQHAVASVERQLVADGVGVVLEFLAGDLDVVTREIEEEAGELDLVGDVDPEAEDRAGVLMGGNVGARAPADRLKVLLKRFEAPDRGLAGMELVQPGVELALERGDSLVEERRPGAAGVIRVPSVRRRGGGDGEMLQGNL